jgi:peptidoglycan/LPS O-acetylase OafA/YrhL
MTTTAPHDASLGDLVAKLQTETSALIRDEMRLAQLEMSRKGKYAGIGAGLFGGAAFLGYFGVATLVAAAVLGLAEVVPAWAAALIVAGALFLVAGVAALFGKKELGQVGPPVPTEAIESVKLDLTAVKR